MDVGNPSNFERMLWLYGGDVDAMRRDIVGSRHATTRSATTIKRVYETRGYLLDPHSGDRLLGLSARSAVLPAGAPAATARSGIFLATAHPAKFREIVEPIIGRAIETPAPLAEALARPRHILRIPASLDAVAGILGG